jgi:hypothetical protein
MDNLENTTTNTHFCENMKSHIVLNYILILILTVCDDQNCDIWFSYDAQGSAERCWYTNQWTLSCCSLGRKLCSARLIIVSSACVIPFVGSHFVDACLDPHRAQVLFIWCCSGKVFCRGSFHFQYFFLWGTPDMFLHFWRNKITVQSVSVEHVDSGTDEETWDLLTIHNS